MVTKQDVNLAVEALTEEIQAPDDFASWAARVGVAEDVLDGVSSSGVRALAEIVAESQGVLDASVLGVMFQQAFTLGFTLGRAQVPDEALPDLDNVLDEHGGLTVEEANEEVRAAIEEQEQRENPSPGDGEDEDQ